jgi:D-serine deaminase-like pyridoxal phosphate-dependent protein
MKLTKPTLLLDEQKCLANIEKFSAKSRQHRVKFRPHFKTHQSATVGNWFRNCEVTAIAVSSVDMAGFFAHHGWNDITIAFPVNVNEFAEIDQLAARCRLNITIENPEAVDFLKKHLQHRTGAFIKIDAGYHRTGIAIEDFDTIARLSDKVQQSKVLQMRGFLIHNGHTYHAATPQQILQFHEESLDKISVFKQRLANAGLEGIISVGDTPALSLTENFGEIDEIRPGNFVFYDLMQQNLGACRYNEIAVVLACPVVAKHASRNEIVVHGGAVHLSKEYIDGTDGEKCYGKIVQLHEAGWSAPVADTFVRSLSQEHGIIKASDEYFDRVRTGDFVGILPVHSCLTVAAMRRMFTLSGDEILLHPWD